MRFLILIAYDESTWPEATAEQRQEFADAHHAFEQAVYAHGELVSGDALASSDRGFTVRHTGSGWQRTEGPFAETAEQIGGFYLIDVTDELGGAKGRPVPASAVHAHPSLSPESASALSLRLVVGVPTLDLARLFLVSEPTMAARLTRARKRLVGAEFGMPSPSDLPARLAVVGQVAYLAFTTGYAPGSGHDLLRADVAGEAVRLATVVHDLVPDQPLPTALLALMLLQHSRRDARVDADGRLVLLPDQDRGLWRTDEIAAATALLAPLAGADLEGEARSYLLQALIAAEHATAVRAADTDWVGIAALYAELETHTGSPVVRLNRAVAVAEASGPNAGLSLLDGLDPALPGSHRLPAVRAELLVRAGRTLEAAAELDVAVSRCGNAVERAHLERRRSEIG